MQDFLRNTILLTLLVVGYCETTCFQNRDELAQAVNDYLRESGPESRVAKTYGWPIGSWCVSQVTDFRGLFENATDFNEDLSKWDTSNAISMASMFSMAASFNHPVSSWDVSKVQDMRYMFLGALSFNQDLSSWNVSNVVSMKSMFFGAAAFDGDVSTWNVENCMDMRALFFGATSFNKDVSKWNISHKTEMDEMFLDAASFRQDLCNWGTELQGKTNFDQHMFEGTNCPSHDDPDWVSASSGPFCYPCQLQQKQSPQDAVWEMARSISFCPVGLIIFFVTCAFFFILSRRNRDATLDADSKGFELLQILDEV